MFGGRVGSRRSGAVPGGAPDREAVGCDIASCPWACSPFETVNKSSFFSRFGLGPSFPRSAAVGCLTLAASVSLPAAVVFEEEFGDFTLGDRWQAHGAGVPDLSLHTVNGLGGDGSVLRLGSSPGAADEIVGIEIAAPFATAGVRSIRVTARVRPLNQTGAGDGGASDASAGIAILGASGTFVRVSAGANRPTAPDWGDFYVDSEGSANANAAFVHFPPNDPAGGAEAFRTFVVEIGEDGVSLTTLASGGEPLAVTPFEVRNPNLTLASFGDRFTVAVFQQRSDGGLAPEPSYGDVDRVTVETVQDEDDRDGDGIPNVYETANGLNPDVDDSRSDLDGDGLSNLAEFQRGTRANQADSDGDTLRDGVETATGVFVGASDTGTNPLKADSDNDGVTDPHETRTGRYLGAGDTGTDPNVADTDGDGFGDGLEVGAGFDPTKTDSTPAGAATIRTAVEFQFFAAPGVNYRIEGSADLQAWTVVEASVPGTGAKVSRLYSTESRPLRFFRAVAN